MNSVTATASQSLADLAVQQYGTLEAVVQFTFANALSLTDELQPGQELLLPEEAEAKPTIADYYAKKLILPATALTDDVDDIIHNEDQCNYCKCFT